MLKRLIGVFLLCSFTTAQQSMGDSLKPIIEQRFLKSLDLLDQTLSSEQHSIESLLKSLTQGRHRLAAFNLQALGQIYQNYPLKNSRDFFKDTLRFEAKSLEDSIGLIDKWATLIKSYENKKVSGEKLFEAQENLNQAWMLLHWIVTGKDYELSSHELTEDSTLLFNRYVEGKKKSLYNKLFWVGENSITKQLKEDLKNYPWLTFSDDRTYVLDRVQDQLKDIQKQTFNFNLLEDTPHEKGLHEFRREIRWFSFQASNLDGLVQLKTDSVCPSEEIKKDFDLIYYPKLKSSPYVRLPKGNLLEESQVCRISSCLFFKLTYIVSQVGDLKDDVEQINHLENLHNQTPTQTALKTQEIYNDLISSNTLGLLRDEIKGCIKK